MVIAGLVIRRESTGEGTLGAFFAQHMVLLRREFFAPLRIGNVDFRGRAGLFG